MPIQILMPALSPTMEEGKLAKWLVQEGSRIKPGDVIAEIETDKATMEVEAVDEGIVAQLLIDAGTEKVKVNTPIAVLRGEGEAAGAAPAAKPAPAPQAAATQAPHPHRLLLRLGQPRRPLPRRRAMVMTQKARGSLPPPWRGGWPAMPASISRRCPEPGRTVASSSATSRRPSARA
jgi:pyruvate dehydrogenase E1 component beta subunit